MRQVEVESLPSGAGRKLAGAVLERIAVAKADGQGFDKTLVEKAVAGRQFNAVEQEDPA